MWRLVAIFLAVFPLAGCSGTETPLAPSSVSLPTATVVLPPVKHVTYPTGATLVGVGISGVVSEATAEGTRPLEGVSVYCDACGEFGHTFTTTDADGFYSFSGDVSRGGGVWIASGYTTYLIVRKDGFRDPPGLPDSTWPGNPPAGWREVTVSGDTRFDIQLITSISVSLAAAQRR